MEKLEKIKTQYMLYDNECVPKNVRETKCVAKTFMHSLNNTINKIHRAMNENSRDQQFTIIKNYFLDLFDYELESVDNFDYDNNLLVRHETLARKYLSYFSKIKSITNEYNYVDMCSLAMFTYDNYESNCDYIESLRDGVVYMVKGITYYPVGEDDKDAFEEFFEETINSLSSKNKQYKR